MSDFELFLTLSIKANLFSETRLGKMGFVGFHGHCVFVNQHEIHCIYQ